MLPSSPRASASAEPATAARLGASRLAPHRRNDSFALRAFLAICCALAVAVPPAFLTGCGSDKPEKTAKGKTSGKAKKRTAESEGDEEEDSDDDGTPFGRLQAQAEKLLKDAKTAGAVELFADEVDKAKTRIEDAEDLATRGEIEKATSKMQLAVNALKSSIAEAKSVKALLAEAATQKKAADDARSAAEKEKAKENAVEYYRDAVATYDRAAASLAKKTEDGAKQAKVQFTEAVNLFQQARDLAKENAAIRVRAEQEKTAMADLKKKAADAKASERVLDAWVQAESYERDAETSLAAGDFSAAHQAFTNARQAYLNCITRIQEEEQFANLVRESAARDASAAGSGAAAEGGIPVDYGSGQAPPIGEPEPGGTVTPLPPPIPVPGAGTGTTELANCFGGFDVEQFPHQIDDEDEALIREYLPKESPLGAPTYDPITGLIQLNYSIGRFVRREVDALSTPAKNLEWEDFTVSQIKTEDLTDDNAWGIGGNTQGLVLFPIPFRYKVQIRFNLQIGLMTNTGTFGVLLNYDKKRKSHLRTNFLNIGTATSGPPKLKPGPGNTGTQNANYWHDKTRQVPWVVTYQMPHPNAADKPLESAEFTATYFAENPDNERQNSIRLGKSFSRGYIGIHWGNTKFRLFDLKVCGILDKELFVQQVREKYKLKKGASRPADAPPADPAPEPATESPDAGSTEGADPAGATGEGGDAAPPEAGASARTAKKATPLEKF